MSVYNTINKRLNIYAPHIMREIAKQAYSPTNSQGWPEQLHDELSNELVILVESINTGDIMFNDEPVQRMTYLKGRNGHRVLHSVRDEPAVIYRDGTMEWYKKGKLHRQDGPAIVYRSSDGSIHQAFYINGREQIP